MREEQSREGRLSQSDCMSALPFRQSARNLFERRARRKQREKPHVEAGLDRELLRFVWLWASVAPVR
jgi:hypothetical protein